MTRAWLIVPSATNLALAGNDPCSQRKPDSIQLKTFWQFRSRRMVSAITKSKLWASATFLDETGPIPVRYSIANSFWRAVDSETMTTSITNNRDIPGLP